MNKANTKMVIVEGRSGEPLSEQEMDEIKAVNALRDEDIDFSDIPPLPRGWSKNAKRFDEVFKARKEAISVRIDADVLMWLKAGGQGYQSRLNEILRERMNAEASK
jgi:uncharacterized protein (DUF4415 family)